jgi:hypothetical protein
MEGGHRVVGEPAAPEGGGRFVSTVRITLSERDELLGEAGGKVHSKRYSPASYSSIYRPIVPPSSDSMESYVPMTTVSMRLRRSGTQLS